MRDLGVRHLGRPLQELGWRFEFDRARRRLGLCRWKRGPRSTRIISLSRSISAREGWTLMEDVARHEVAHAIDFETRGRSGHDRTWKAWAVLCGADPTRTYEGELADDPASRYVGRCTAPDCSYTRPFYRTVTSRYLCRRCRDGGTRSLLRVEERATGRTILDWERGIRPRRRPPRSRRRA